MFRRILGVCGTKVVRCEHLFWILGYKVGYWLSCRLNVGSGMKLTIRQLKLQQDGIKSG